MSVESTERRILSVLEEDAQALDDAYNRVHEI